MLAGWEAVIGLEVHVQLATRTKLFCRCPNRFGAEPNSLVCPVCLGYPGTLPVLNGGAVDLAVRLACALGCEVHPTSTFARKNYFYADLPKGYQISQYDQPLAEGGAVPLARHPGAVRLHRLHLEEDAGKLLHEAPGGAPLADVSLVDFNRCGVPLVEIVSEPEMRSPSEAEDFLRVLHRVLLYTGTSDGNMEQGSLRCDANVSVRRAGSGILGTKTEVKNLNSFRNVARALAAEIERQTELLEAGEAVMQETRGFDADRGSTWSLRGKEEAHDYRYFPEPDLRPLVLAPERVARLRDELPELPWDRQARFVDSFELAPEEAADLTATPELAEHFERTVAAGEVRPRAVGNWLRNEVLRELNARRAAIASAPAPDRLAELLSLVDRGELSAGAAKTVLAEIWESPERPTAAMHRLGLAQVSDEAQLLAWVAAVIEEHEDKIDELRGGNTKILSFLIGQVMKRSSGRADPKRVRALLAERYGEAAPVP